MNHNPEYCRHDDPKGSCNIGRQVMAPMRAELPRDFLGNTCIHHLFEEQARRAPDREAIRCEARAFTYGQLNRRANRLAQRLRQLGVGPDDLVALCAERSLEMVVGMLGILKAGGAYLPLDPTHPRERLALILQDSSTSVLVTQSQMASSLPTDVPHRVFLDDIDETPVDQGPPYHVTSRHLAYVMYTSGSTGTPKGVCIEHRAVVNFIFAMQECPGICASDRILALTTVSFDMSVLEILLPLAIGGQVVIATDSKRLDTRSLIAMIESANISVVQATPAMWRALLSHNWTGTRQIKALSGGEAMPAELAREMLQRFDSVWNLYGPTESTVYASGKRLEPTGEVTIGRPLANTRVYILDETRQPIPEGVVGELYIGGEGLARGFLNRPELTAERFLPDPFDSNFGARMYRTGDLGRRREDGDIEYLGRADQQVKIRGFRIELEEVEAVLRQHPQVAQCAVAVQTDATGGKQLVAFLVPREQAVLAVREYRQWLAAKLPDYMIPARFSTLDTLPLNPNGKLDRKTLQSVAIQTLPNDSEYVAPCNELEGQLVQIWQEVFRPRESIGIHDHFLDLGGHSLLAMRIVSQLASRLAIHAPVRWILEYPTIGALAQQLESTDRTLYGAEPIPCVSRQTALPMSFGQQRFWILQETLPDPATYNVPVVHRITGPVDTDLLRICLQRLFERHEALRTALMQEGDSLRQEIAPVGSLALPWRETDWQAFSIEEQEATIREEVRRPFDLKQAPLWRVLWSALGHEEHLLALTFHHTVVDEWSMRLFFYELEQLYAVGGNTEKAGLSALTVQYADYAVWQRRRLTDERRQRDTTYWAEQLKDPPPPLPLPSDVSSPKHRSDRGAVHRFALPQYLVKKLRRLARAEGVSLFTLMLAAYQVWFYRYTGQDDVIVATPVADRDREELQGLVGYFLNTLPVRTRLAGQASFLETLAQVRQTVMACLAHGALPFEEIVDAAGPGEDGSRTTLHQVMFVLLEEGVAPWRFGDVATEIAIVHTDTTKCDLLMNIVPERDQWVCEFEYATDLFTADSIQRMATHWLELLCAIAANPDQRIVSLNLMPESERRQVMETWNDTQRAYPRNMCVHELFDEQADKTPNAISVSCDEQVLTYRELNQRANRLANFLRHMPIDTGTCVGVFLGRSIDFVISVLAIMKAGGTYVPLAQDIPLERLQHILTDSATTVVITNSPLPENMCAPHITVVDLNREAAEIESSGQQPVDCHIKPTDPAYVMYTSGSTGRPKGVAVPHRAIVRLVCSQEYVDFDAPQRFLLLAPTSFDASTFELWSPLLHGNSCAIFPQPLPELTLLEKTIQEQKVTCLWLTAGLFNQIIDQRPSILEKVQHVLTGGESLSVVHVQRALERLPNLRLTNGYGPTECTTFACTYRIAHATTFAAGSVPIGRPIANTQCYVLDDAGAPVPVGVVGELYLGGDGLASGYLNLPDLTAERFVAHPFSNEPGARLYRTGDYVRYNTDGLLEFLGRRDQQIKIRGFRIELGEIEAVLQTHPEIVASAVVLEERHFPDKQLVAWLVPRTPADLSGHALRTWLESRLPAYMLPERFHVVNAIPLTQNGKVDRKTLARRVDGELQSGIQYVAPNSDLEHSLAEIWRNVLHCDRIGVHDNFFERGGNSLTAVQVIGRIQSKFGILLPVADLFARPTIARFAEVASRRIATPGVVDSGVTGREDERPPIFLLEWHLDISDLTFDDRKCYVIPFPDISETQDHCCVEYIASKCLETLRSVQPCGPYYLIGFSLAGLVAHELTRQLRIAGEEVAFAAIIDTLPPSLRQRMTIQWIALLGKLFRVPFPNQVACMWRVLAMRIFLAKNVKKMVLHPGRFVQNVIRAIAKRPNRMAGNADPSAEVKPSIPCKTSRTALPIDAFSNWAYCTYAPKSAPGSIYLLLTEEMVSNRSARVRHWTRYVTERREFVIPGEHLTCVREHKSALVDALRECLDDAELRRKAGSGKDINQPSKR